jgi:hypothetical protein
LVTRRIEPSQRPRSRSMFVYRRYGPKYTPFVGLTLYWSTPAIGGGPVNPAAVGVASGAMPKSFWKPGVEGWNPGDWIGAFPKPTGLNGFTNVPVGDMGSLRFSGVGPLGNSHWVDCVGRWM